MEIPSQCNAITKNENNIYFNIYINQQKLFFTAVFTF